MSAHARTYACCFLGSTDFIYILRTGDALPVKDILHARSRCVFFFLYFYYSFFKPEHGRWTSKERLSWSEPAAPRTKVTELSQVSSWYRNRNATATFEPPRQRQKPAVIDEIHDETLRTKFGRRKDVNFENKRTCLGTSKIKSWREQRRPVLKLIEIGRAECGH